MQELIDQEIFQDHGDNIRCYVCLSTFEKKNAKRHMASKKHCIKIDALPKDKRGCPTLFQKPCGCYNVDGHGFDAMCTIHRRTTFLKQQQQLPTRFCDRLDDVKRWVSCEYHPVVQDIANDYCKTGFLDDTSIRIINRMWDEIPQEFKDKYSVERK